MSLPVSLRHAWRRIASSPGPGLAVVVSCALGVAAFVAVDALDRAIVRSPLAYRHAEDLVLVWNQLPGAGYERLPMSDADFFDLRESGALEQVAAFVTETLTVTGRGEPRELTTVAGEPALWRLLGLEPALGRVPATAEEVMLSAAIWRGSFAADPAALGQVLDVEGRPRRVVGVMGEGAVFPPPISWNGQTVGDGHGADLALWLDISRGRPRSQRRLMVVGRCFGSEDLGDVRGRLAEVAFELASRYPASNPPQLSMSAVGLRAQVTESLGPRLRVLQAAVLLLLIVGCANAALVQLARLVGRCGELAIHAALGADRRRLLGQLAVESLILAAASAALGAFLAAIAIDSFRQVAADLPYLDRVAVDWKVAVTAGAASLVAAVLFAAAPALWATSGDLSPALKAADSRAGDVHLRRLQAALVIAGITLAVPLMAAGALLLKDYRQLAGNDPGFRTQGVLEVRFRLLSAYGGDSHTASSVAPMLAALQDLPAVEMTAAASSLPLTAGLDGAGFAVRGRTGRSLAVVRHVTGDYFRVLGIPLHEGEAWVGEGADPSKVVVSHHLARSYWPGQSAIGRQLTFEDPRRQDARWLRVVGVVGDVAQEDLRQVGGMVIYQPFLASLSPRVSLLVSTKAPPALLAPAVREALRQVSPDLPVLVRSVGTLVEAALEPPRLASGLTALFALLALGLAAVGLYGAMAFRVSRHRRELAIRSAIGAGQGDLRRLVLKQALRLGATGAGLGLLASLFVGQLLEHLVYGVEVGRLSFFVAIAFTCLPVVLVAAWIPAQRAMRIDPASALRGD